ncbi:MAG: glycoside hydrolase family protein [Eubacteriales bacterium]|nr:glycoside hydrolase family protein [Eubacteriales bacterium]
MRQLPELLARMLPAPRKGGFRMEGYWIWCGSVIMGEDGKYHMFASRWPKSQPMHPGWLLESEIVRAVSDTPEGPYTFQEVVLGKRGPAYWDGRMTHNPRIVKSGDSYILYYTGTTHPFADVRPGETVAQDDPRVITARANKRVGIAVSKSVYGPWERKDAPLLAARPGKFDSFLTSNPSPCQMEDGSTHLIYKARAYKEPPYEGMLHGPMSLGAARFGGSLDCCLERWEKPLFSDARYEIEDPFVFRENGCFYMIAKDMRGNLCGEQYGGLWAWSEDGWNWSFAKGEKAYSRTVLFDDGRTETLGNADRPFLLFDADGEATHLFLAVSNGTNSFLDATDTWNLVIPLKGKDGRRNETDRKSDHSDRY